MRMVASRSPLLPGEDPGESTSSDSGHNVRAHRFYQPHFRLPLTTEERAVGLAQMLACRCLTKRSMPASTSSGGSGIGRYGTAELPDSTVRPDGTLALLRSYQALGTLEFHPTPKLDIYMNAGGEYASRASYAYTNLVTGKGGTAGYGSPAFRNDGCSVETLPIAAPGGTINTTSVLGSNGFIPGCTRELRWGCAGHHRRHDGILVPRLQRRKGPHPVRSYSIPI